MKNPNTAAAVVAYAVSIGVQWLVQRYAHAALSAYWQQTVDAAVTAAVLYVGRNGVKNALTRLWTGPAKMWAGSTVTAAK